MAYTWDAAKRESNLRKHGLDFSDAALVYEAPDALVMDVVRKGEQRTITVAMRPVAGKMVPLTVVTTARGMDVRLISFRRASEKERRELSRRMTS